MKITKKFLNDKYDELCKRMDLVLERYNPCGIEFVNCTACGKPKNFITNEVHKKNYVFTNGHPYRLHPKCNGYGSMSDALCCDASHYHNQLPTCVHMSKQINKGCKVKSLRCKLWLCSPTIWGATKSSYHTVMIPGKYLQVPNLDIHSEFIFIDLEHRAIFDEARKWKLILLFREGKAKALAEAWRAWEEEL